MKKTWFYIWLAFYLIVVSAALLLHWIVFRKSNAWIPLIPLLFSSLSFGSTYYLIDSVAFDIEDRLKGYGIIVDLAGNPLYDARQLLKNTRITANDPINGRLRLFVEMQRYSLYIGATILISIGLCVLLWYI